MRKHNNETYEAFEIRKREAKKALLRLFREDIVDDDEFDELLDAIEKDEEDEGLKVESTTVEDASKIINGMILHSFRTTHDGENPSEKWGNGFTFRTGLEEEVSKYRELFIKNDGTVYISEEY